MIDSLAGEFDEADLTSEYRTNLRQMLEARGFAEGSNAAPGHYVVEKAFVER